MNRSDTTRTQKITSIKPTAAFIIVLALFIAAAFAFAYLGTNIYKNYEAGRSASTTDSAADYLTDQIRQCEDPSDVRIASLGGDLPSLVITSEDDDDNILETWFFTYDGSLCRIDSKAGDSITAVDGTPVMDLESVEFEMLRDDLMEITVTAENGAVATVNVYLPGGGGSNE